MRTNKLSKLFFLGMLSASFLSSCNSSKKTDTVNTDTDSERTSEVKNTISFKLPNEVMINSTSKDSVEYYVVNWLKDDTRIVDKTTWFNFDKLLFDAGQKNLKEDSKEQLKNIVEIMKAFPTMEIKLGAYTDKTEVSKDHMKLSTERAALAKEELVKLGLVETRIKPEGYGDLWPVASNDTEEGRAQNRRIAVRITKK
jgi:OmpA-OmpF porin, OOP family